MLNRIVSYNGRNYAIFSIEYNCILLWNVLYPNPEVHYTFSVEDPEEISKILQQLESSNIETL